MIIFMMVVHGGKYISATVLCQVHKIRILIKDKLTKEQLQMFHKTIFGSLINVNMIFNGQLIHHFLLRQKPKEANANGIYFSILGKKYLFHLKQIQHHNWVMANQCNIG